MPTNSTESDEEQVDAMFRREIDGTVYHIKAVGITYRQRVRSNQCFVEYDNQLLPENAVIKIRKKNFRVENCSLERVYHACGPNLLLMLSLVCRVIDQDVQSYSHSFANFKRSTSLSPRSKFRSTTFSSNRVVITDSCCENFCSIPELTRYCHQ
ncbi:unnamed protein product [Adineta ricciae]|uniref:Insulin-like domain-containing protein n=1 Tax=Adineta ricciae TaxID=249248 RepID=A0A813Y520_ADIRI|nr:unnamed protein product [Adineta ricciae]CAF0897409.1 unnamed protein product [Adineta ricciae]